MERNWSRRGNVFRLANNPRIVRLFSTPVEIPISGTLLLLNNKDGPASLPSRHAAQQTQGQYCQHEPDARHRRRLALTVLNLDSTRRRRCSPNFRKTLTSAM